MSPNCMGSLKNIQPKQTNQKPQTQKAKSPPKKPQNTSNLKIGDSYSDLMYGPMPEVA